MKYTKTNNIHIVEVPIKDFKIIMNDSKKKSATSKNYCNAGFFANFSENNQPFTLPVAHLVCDYDSTSSYTKKYCTERGKFNGKKFTFDSSKWSYGNAFYKKAISTLLVNNTKAEIKEVISVPTGYNYAISGIPIMRDGVDCSFNNDVKPQGWDSSPLYGTWHTFVGLKKDSNSIYVIGMKTTTWNMISTSEAYKKLKELGMYDVIKLDGGGSFHMNINGKTVVSTSEDRRINTIISFGESNSISFDDVNKDKTDKEFVTGTMTDKDSVSIITTTTTASTTIPVTTKNTLKNMIKKLKFRNVTSSLFDGRNIKFSPLRVLK